ncbi:MAG: class I SAM-dependent methyltransferase [Acidobacteria bacterium]|nr:class I SAM-dependent methyltransferase [Acidobacteriota bacterium]
MADSTRTLTDLFGLLGHRRAAPTAPAVTPSPSASPTVTYPTKALPKFIKALRTREHPVLVDLGPVVGSNVTFFGEQLGCRIRVEDLAQDIERHVKADTVDRLPAFFSTRFTEEPESVDGVLCWDVFDYLEKPAVQALATALSTMVKPGGALLGFFSSVDATEPVYTKYVVADTEQFDPASTDVGSILYRTYPASRPRQRALLTGDIIRLFKDLRVSDSFQMKNKVREILFRKPA